MKKVFTLLLTLSLLLTLFAAGTVSGSAANVEYVEEVYSYNEVVREYYGLPSAEGAEENTAHGSLDKKDGFFMGAGNEWTFEYLDEELGGFYPMTAFFKNIVPGMLPNNQKNLYLPFPDSGWSDSPYLYCCVGGSGRWVIPGTGAAPSITFIAPAEGTLSMEAAFYVGTKQLSTAEGTGNFVSIWVNDTMVWPAEGETEATTLYYDTNASRENPFKLSCNGIKVKANDKVRLVFAAAKDVVKGVQGVDFGTVDNYPVITYTDCVVPIGNPKGNAPLGVAAKPVNKTSTDTKISWGAVEGATGYNIYVAPLTEEEKQKANAEPISGTNYTLTGLEPNTMYILSMTAITAAGESVPSEDIVFTTNDSSAASGDNASDKTPDKNNDTNVPVTDSNTSSGNPSGLLIGILAGVGVLIVALVVVLIVVLGKKKKPAAEPAPQSESGGEQ